LNDVTVILLLVPLSIQIAVAVGIHPFVLVIPEVLISNIGGAATLIGNPPSTIVGSHIGASFAEYMVNMAPIAVICMLAAILVNRFQYRKEYAQAGSKVSPVLVEALEAESRISNRKTLVKALIIAALTFTGFFLADLFDRMPPGVVALSGAALLVAWVRPDMHRMLREVDWTTLLFFIGLFIVVAGMERTGAIEWLATRVAILAGESLKRAALLTTWISGIASGIVANIPFTVAALPVADFLTETLPGAADSGIIYWALILGADLGGNATYLGSAPNIVALGLLGQAGFRLTFGRFVRDAMPVTIVTMILASIWLLIRY
jgi:Na+/H+ antiporter NhaD/arsenite permease-like protein